MTNRLQEILEKTEIKLPKLLNYFKADELLYHIANTLHYEITFIKENHERILPLSERKSDISVQLIRTSIRGSILSKYATANFHFNDSPSDSSKIESLRFDSIPGYSLGDHNPKEIEIWDKVRSLVQDYFED